MTIDELKRRTDVFVVIADEYGFITHINSQGRSSKLGWESSDLVGKPLTTLIPKRLHDSHNLGFSRFLVTGTPTLLNKPLNLKVIAKDGSELESKHFIIAEQKQGKWFFGATIEPL